ncbi:DNA cytosine methyltransferase [Listeria fleischmannii]
MKDEVNSDSQLYKQAGNSVTVNVIEAIAKEMEKREGKKTINDVL